MICPDELVVIILWMDLWIKIIPVVCGDLIDSFDAKYKNASIWLNTLISLGRANAMSRETIRKEWIGLFIYRKRPEGFNYGKICFFSPPCMASVRECVQVAKNYDILKEHTGDRTLDRFSWVQSFLWTSVEYRSCHNRVWEIPYLLPCHSTTAALPEK